MIPSGMIQEWSVCTSW